MSRGGDWGGGGDSDCMADLGLVMNHISEESAQWIVGACSRKCSAVENPEQHVTAEICFDCSPNFNRCTGLNTHDQNLNYR